MPSLFRKTADAHEDFANTAPLGFWQKYLPLWLRNQYAQEEVRYDRIVYAGNCSAELNAIFRYHDDRDGYDIRVTFCDGRVVAEKVAVEGV